MPKISIPQRDLAFEVSQGKNLMDALIEHGLPVASSCLGEGICSKCAVRMKYTHSPDQNSSLALSELEKNTLLRNKLDLSYRLSCQVFVNQDISVETSYW